MSSEARFYSEKYASIQISLPVETTVVAVGGRQALQHISPGNIEFKGHAYKTKDEKEKAVIRSSQLFKAGIIVEIPAGLVSPEKTTTKGSPVVGALSQKNIVDPAKQTAEGAFEKVKVSDRNSMVAFLVSKKGAKPEELKGKKLPEVEQIAKDVYKVEFVKT